MRNRLPELLIKAMVIFGYKLLVLTIYQSYSDEVLLDLIKAEDEAAFRCLYERYWARLLGQAFATLKKQGRCRRTGTNSFFKPLETQTVPTYTVLPGHLLSIGL